MDGANMAMAEDMPMDAGMPMPEEEMVGLTPEAVSRLMMPSEEIGAVLMARLVNMSQDELAMLDSVITPDIANILKRLLPELTSIIEQIEGGQVMAEGEMMMAEEPMMMAEEEVGALGAMG
tara:strand:+ start:115 stop:477 length:363 start_codon:yes stop_codon:yes gene_type:complete